MLGEFMKNLFAIITFMILNVSNAAFASHISGTMSYEYNKQIGQPRQLTPDVTLNLNYDLNHHLYFHGTFESNRTNNQPTTNTINNAYLEYQKANHDYIIGKQTYTLSNGLIASMSGVNGICVNFESPKRNTTIFYGKNSKNILSAEWKLNQLGNNGDSSLGINYFQDNNHYIGITAFSKICHEISCTVETAKNLNTMDFGYLITLEHGNIQNTGDINVSASYRNIKPEAVSEYCTDSNYTNSKGFRIGLTSKINKEIILSAYHDIAESLSKTSIGTTYIAVSSNF